MIRQPDRITLDKYAGIRYFSRVISSQSRRRASDLLRDRASRGSYHFSTEELANELGVSLTAARSSLRRLKNKRLVATPYRGFHVVVPPEHQRLGCLPAEQFVPQLMDRLGVPYYAGLLTSARYHGAAHQQPQVFQVVVPKNRPPIHCGLVKVAFVARRNGATMPTRRVNTPRGFLRVARPEVTAYDLVGYQGHCGGLENVATVLSELGESLDPTALSSLGEFSPIPWSQRLGFLLDLVGHSSRSKALADFVEDHATETAVLVPGGNKDSANRNARWKLLVNADLEPDL